MSAFEKSERQAQPSTSALRVATARAVHQLLDDPIVLEDPFALPVLGPELCQSVSANPFQYNDPAARSMRAAIIGRSRLAEDAFTAALAKGVKQLVILGAGLDTYTLRNAATHPDVIMVEVDQPTTQDCKRQRLAECGTDLPDNGRWLALDLASEDLVTGLEQAGCRLDRPTWFSCLGVTPYLTDEDVWHVLEGVASFATGSGIVFDYRLPGSLLNPIEQVMERMTAEMFSRMGEPWLAHFEPTAMVDGLRRRGFASVRDVNAQELNQRYFARRKDGLQSAGGGFRYIVAER